MRVWYGIDKEFNPMYGKLTLFVESKNPDVDVIVSLLDYYDDLDIKCIYFGAGEVDIENWDFIKELYKLR